MNNKEWLQHTGTLHGELVELRPLAPEHFAELAKFTEERRIWEFLPIDCSTPEKYTALLYAALEERANGNQFPYVIFHKADNKIIGSTRLMDIQAIHRKLEIGWTWLHPDYWATAVNFECKLLLLQHCFETLEAMRVMLKTDENNIRSQKAIKKIGATYEGILRCDMMRYNGTYRNSAYFSVIAPEWEGVKKHLTDLYLNKKMQIS